VHQGFDTQTETIKALKQCGVPDAVILAMGECKSGTCTCEAAILCALFCALALAVWLR
jgi:hypothetical protein